MENETTSKKSKSVVSRIINIALWIFLAFAVVIVIFALASTFSDDGVPAIFGKAILTVSTESMDIPDDYQKEHNVKEAFNKGSLIIGEKLDLEEAEALDVNDIVTFKVRAKKFNIPLDNPDQEVFITHRIVEKRETSTGIVFVTKGDNPITNTKTDEEQYGFVLRADDVICKYNGFCIHGFGNALDFLRSSTGFLIFIVLPMLVFFIVELVNFIKTFLSIKNAGKKVITEADEESIRRQAIEEYLRQQQLAAQNNAETVKVEDNTNSEEKKE